MKRKILLLTLGTGDLRNAKESAGYRMTQYTINGCSYQKNGEDKQTNFVAEPIIDFLSRMTFLFLVQLNLYGTSSMPQ